MKRSANEPSSKQLGGCFTAVWSLCVTSPMWFVILFMLLQATEMPTWVWGMYWGYVPAQLLQIAFAAIVREFTDE